MTFKEFWQKYPTPKVNMPTAHWELLRTVAEKAFNAGRAAQRKESKDRGNK